MSTIQNGKLKNALIIGGSGGLSSVVARLALKKYNVWTVTRGQRELPEGVTAIVADRNNKEQFAEAIFSQNVKWDVVFDCICMNAEQARQDLEVLSKVTKRLVVVSTDSVYHPLYKETPQTEEGVFTEEEGDTASVSYGCNKRRMEEVFQADMESNMSGLQTTIFRPGHIYGPGFLLGCFPENSRQKELPDLILRGESLKLVGMGTYLIQPIYVDDLAEAMVECVDKEKAFQQIFCIGGPKAVENRRYYECIGQALGVTVKITEVPLDGYLQRHPEYSGHLCHRIYDMTKLKDAGIPLPKTSLKEGIQKHLISLGYEISNI